MGNKNFQELQIERGWGMIEDLRYVKLSSIAMFTDERRPQLNGNICYQCLCQIVVAHCSLNVAIIYSFVYYQSSGKAEYLFLYNFILQQAHIGKAFSKLYPIMFAVSRSRDCYLQRAYFTDINYLCFFSGHCRWHDNSVQETLLKTIL